MHSNHFTGRGNYPKFDFPSFDEWKKSNSDDYIE
jgi:hypothetical protein